MKKKILTGIVIGLLVVLIAAVTNLPQSDGDLTATSKVTVTVSPADKASNVLFDPNISILTTESTSGLVVLKYSDVLGEGAADITPESLSFTVYNDDAGEYVSGIKTGVYEGSVLNRAWHDVWYSEQTGVFYFAMIISLVLSAILSIIYTENNGRAGVHFDPAEKVLVAGGHLSIAGMLSIITIGMIDSSYYLFEISQSGLFICLGLVFALIYIAASSVLIFALMLVSVRRGHNYHAQAFVIIVAGIFYYACFSSGNPILYGMNILYIPVLLFLSLSLIAVTFLRRNVKVSGDNLQDDEKTIVFDRKSGKTRQRMPIFPEELYKNYRDVSIAGAGGIAIVFHAKRLYDERTVAIKLPLNKDEITGKSFIREIGVWEKLRHKNIVKVYSVNILPVPYIEMEYIRRNLLDLIYPLPAKEALNIFTGILEGLFYAHKKGIVHHDIKPGNVLIDSENNPKLTDWGLCRTAGDNYEYSNLGFSFVYAAPEQIFPSKYGKPDTRTDIYQSGLLFYEILTGRKPITGDILEEYLKEEKTVIIPVSQVLNNDSYKEFDKIIMKCLEKDPSLRYQDIDSLLSDVKNLKEKYE
ncbi:MAG: serine/threonine protein kinase [Methanomicrobiaceae archaeon]|nr:serine/threonine protein kinase [Methanomicrobiaceae archaeon]